MTVTRDPTVSYPAQPAAPRGPVPPAVRMMPPAAAPVSAADPSGMGLGVVIPVLGAHPQAGVSGIALALADAAASAGARVLLVDCADPARSGLAGVCATEGPSVPSNDGHAAMRLAIRQLPRAEVHVRRMVGSGGPRRPHEVPPPAQWAAAAHGEFDVTIVDIGWDVWPLTIPGEGLGALLWCRGAPAGTFPVLVMRTTSPSVALVEGVLSRYHVGIQRLGFVNLYGLVAIGAESWPAPTRVVMGYYLRHLLPRTVLVPLTPDAVVGGWTTAPTPPASQQVAARLLYGLGGNLAQAVGPPPAARRGRRSRED